LRLLRTNEIVDLDLFPLSLDMSPYRFYKLADKNDYFCEALEVARYHISKRMKAGWCTREFDAKYCSEFLPEVNHYYRSWITHKATLNAQAKQEQKTNTSYSSFRPDTSYFVSSREDRTCR